MAPSTTASSTTAKSDRPSARRHRRVTDLFLAMIAVVAATCVQFADAEHELRTVLMLTVPALYIVLAKTLAAAPLATAAGRTYLLFFFSGLLGLSVRCGHVARVLAASAASSDQTADTLLIELVAVVPVLLTQLLLPLLAGVAVYLVCSTCDRSEDGCIDAPFEFNESLRTLDAWLSDSDAPRMVREVLGKLVEQVSDLTTRYGQLADQSVAATRDMSQVAAASVDTAGALAQLRDVSRETTALLQALRHDVNSAGTDLGQLGTAVTEIGDVVDQFAEITSARILNQEFPTHA